MKNIFRLLAATAIAALTVSCDLTLYPEDAESPEVYFKSEAHFEQWTNYLYAALLDSLQKFLSVGDYGNAALSAVGILPYVGDLAKCSRLKKGLDAVEAIVKTNKHHLIPKAVYNQFSDVAEFMARDSKVNLLEVPAGFHGNHPAYSKWVTRELEELARDGMTYEKLMDFKRKAVEEIEHAYKIWIDSGKSNNANMNEYFKKLNSHE